MKIKVVKIKTWDRMEQEYGLNKNKMFDETTINTDLHFTETMELFLPKSRIIKIYENAWSPDKHTTFNIDNQMIEKELNPKDYPQYFI